MIYFSVVALILLFFFKDSIIDFLFEYGIIYHIFNGYQRIILPSFSLDNYDELNRNINSIRKNKKIPFIYVKLDHDLKQLINPGISSSLITTTCFQSSSK
jgi:hypothetical protein